MKRILFCIMAVFTLAACKSEIADVEVGPYTISVIDDNVYHIQDYNSDNLAGENFDAEGNLVHFNNCSDIYLIVGKKSALLVDLSNDIKWADNAAESLRQLVAERVDGKPLTITFTHNHGDHTGMLHAFIEDKSIHYALPEPDFNAPAENYPDLDISFINDGYVFDLGGVKIETIIVPGHTDGSAVFSIEGRDILLTGDAIGSGHGVWIFNTDGFQKYSAGVPHLISWIEDPANGIDIEKLRLFGGHYWQKDWFPEMKDKEFGMSYIYDMQALVNEIKDGTAYAEPSGLNHRVLDTYFRHGMATVAWNAAQAEEYSKN